MMRDSTALSSVVSDVLQKHGHIVGMQRPVQYLA